MKLTDITVKHGRRAIDSAKVRELASSMNEIGLINPITVTRDKILVTGAHRLEAAKLLGWTDIEATTFDGSDLVVELAEIDENLMRNELHSLQRGNSWNRRDELLTTMGLRAKAGDNQHKRGPTDSVVPQTTADLAKSMGVSPTVFREEKRVSAAIPLDVQEAVIEAGWTKEDTKRIAKMPEEEQRKVAAEANEGASSLLDARRRIKREEVHSTPELDGKYRVIYADPPWKYGTQLAEGYGSATNHYPTMSEDEMKRLPVSDIADDNCVLFMWATSPLLPECLSVMMAWGFDYKSSFVWDKVKHNMGNYNSVRHELLLIGTKGSCLPEKGVLYDSVVSEERTEHSVKPETFRKIIEDLYPSGKKIELFARQQHENWQSWGNQA